MSPRTSRWFAWLATLAMAAAFWAAVIMAVGMISGCQVVPETPRQAQYAALVTIASMRNLTADLLIRGQIAKVKAQQILDQTDTAEVMANLGDTDSARQLLLRIEADLREIKR